MAEMSTTSQNTPASSTSSPTTGPFLPAHAISHGKAQQVFSFKAQLISMATIAVGYYALLAGEALFARAGLAPERALGLAALASAVVLFVGSMFSAAKARRIALLEQTVAWLIVTVPVVGFLAVAMMGPPSLERFVPPDLLYLSMLFGPNPLGGLMLGAHAVFVAVLLGATFGYLALGGGTLDLRFSFEAHVARQHLRLSWGKVAFVFVLGVISPVLLLVWPLTLIGTTLAYAFSSSATRRRVLEQLMPYIAILGVSIGVCALVTVLSVMSGFEVDLKRKILGTNAHAVVLKYGNDFTEYREIADKVRTVRGVRGVSPFVLNEVMLTSEQNLAGVLIKGIDPSSVGQVTELPENINNADGAGKLEYLTHPDQIPDSNAAHTDNKGLFKELDEATQKAGAQPSKADGKADKKVDDKAGSKDAKPAAKDAEDRDEEGVKADTDPDNKPTSPDKPEEHGTVKSAPPPPTSIPGVVLGRELARTLRVNVGDRINMVSPLGGELGPQGPMPKSRPFKVAAIFFSGMYEYDSKFAYISLDAAQKFFNLGDSVNGLEIKVDDVDNIQVIDRQIKAKIDGYPYRIKDWGEMNRNLFSALRLEKLAMAIMLTFIVLVACINILSTLVVFALQKAKEVAILKSMGARDTGIMKIFVLEGLIIGAIGTLLGLIQGYGCCLFVEKFGIKLDPEVYYISQLPVKLDPAQFVAVALTALLLSYLATIFPALNASRLRPVEGLKTE